MTALTREMETRVLAGIAALAVALTCANRADRMERGRVR